VDISHVQFICLLTMRPNTPSWLKLTIVVRGGKAYFLFRGQPLSPGEDMTDLSIRTSPPVVDAFPVVPQDCLSASDRRFDMMDDPCTAEGNDDVQGTRVVDDASWQLTGQTLVHQTQSSTRVCHTCTLQAGRI
jgi:hypothetical protein